MGGGYGSVPRSLKCARRRQMAVIGSIWHQLARRESNPPPLGKKAGENATFSERRIPGRIPRCASISERPFSSSGALEPAMTTDAIDTDTHAAPSFPQ